MLTRRKFLASAVAVAVAPSVAPEAARGFVTSAYYGAKHFDHAAFLQAQYEAWSRRMVDRTLAGYTGILPYDGAKADLGRQYEPNYPDLHSETT